MLPPPLWMLVDFMLFRLYATIVAALTIYPSESGGACRPLRALFGAARFAGQENGGGNW